MARLPFPNHRVVVALVTVAALVAGFVVWPRHGHGGRGTAGPTAVATRGAVVVTAGGVGRIVEAGAAAPIFVPTSSSGGATAGPGSAATSGSGTTAAPADGVFPMATGHVQKLLAGPGEHLAAGQAVAVLDDGGAAALAVDQARNDLASAQLELAQKRTSDPAKGDPATPAELAAARLAVDVGRQKLTQVTGAPAQTDLTAAQLELAKARSDLEVLTRPPTAAALAAARAAVDVARQKLVEASGPPAQTDVTAAQLELKKAQADLEALQLPSPAATATAIQAAQLAVDLANQKLAQLTGPPNPLAVASAQLDLDKAQVDLESLLVRPSPSAVEAGQLAVTLGEQKLGQLLQPPASSRDAARLDVAKSVAELDVLQRRGGPASRSDIELARLKVEAAAVRLLVAQAQADRLTVRVPSEGVLTSLLTAPGAPADASTPIATVAELRRLAVTVDLSEFDAAKVHRGQDAVVSVDALGGTRLPGTVLVEALAGVDNGGVVTFPVRVGLGRSSGVKPGMSVSVRIVVAQRRDVVRVPLEAISHRRGRPTVTVVDSAGKTSTKRVTLGLADNKDVEIRGGLRPGERVRLVAARGV